MKKIDREDSVSKVYRRTSIKTLTISKNGLSKDKFLVESFRNSGLLSTVFRFQSEMKSYISVLTSKC